MPVKMYDFNSRQIYIICKQAGRTKIRINFIIVTIVFSKAQEITDNFNFKIDANI